MSIKNLFQDLSLNAFWKKNAVKQIELYNYSEVLLNNVLDEDFQRMLRPLYFLHNLVFCSKYYISDNIITPNGLRTIFISFLSSIVFATLFLYRVIVFLINMNISSKEHRFFFYFNNFFDLFFYGFGFIINFVVNYIYSLKNVRLIIKMQELHRIFKCDKTDFRNFIIWGWTCIILNMAFYGVIIVYMHNRNPHFNILEMFCTWSLIIFDMNIIYALQMMKMLVKKLRLWISYVEKLAECNKLMIDIQSMNMNTTYKSRKMFEVYLSILEVYDLFKKALTAMMYYYVLKIFSYSLIYSMMMIQYFKIKPQSSELFDIFLLFFSFFGWLVMNFMIQLALNIECEKFYKSIDDAEYACTILASTLNRTDGDKRLCKNIWRVNRAVFTKISVCGMFTVGASASSELLYQISAYTFVLLQTFLKS